MGRFIYGGSGNGRSFSLSDRELFHIQHAIATKLRCGERFMLTFGAGQLPAGEGWRSFWISSEVPLQFHFTERVVGKTANPAWVAALVSAGYSGEMLLVPEPEWQPPKETPAIYG
jgi:hypothetical protein